MAWFVGVVALVLAGVFAAGYRKAALALAVVAIATGGSLYAHYRAEEHRALTRIPKPELVFENVTLQPYVGSYRIAGRIKNNSAKFSVKQIDFSVTVRDCPRESAAQECVTIGETSEILNLDIPPGETRDFAESVRLGRSNVKLKGRLDWSYSISRIRAE